MRQLSFRAGITLTSGTGNMTKQYSDACCFDFPVIESSTSTRKPVFLFPVAAVQETGNEFVVPPS